MEEGLLVRKIDWGTVIDHIPAWRADRVLRLIDAEQLARDPEVSVIVLKNVPSRKYGRKDVIKLYHHHMSRTDAALVKLIFPTVTVNYIRDWKVEKYQPELPDVIEGRVRCPELTCVSNSKRDPVVRRFRVLKEDGYIQCYYCDAIVEFSSIPDLVVA